MRPRACREMCLGLDSWLIVQDARSPATCHLEPTRHRIPGRDSCPGSRLIRLSRVSRPRLLPWFTLSPAWDMRTPASAASSGLTLLPINPATIRPPNPAIQETQSTARSCRQFGVTVSTAGTRIVQSLQCQTFWGAVCGSGQPLGAPLDRTWTQVHPPGHPCVATSGCSRQNWSRRPTLAGSNGHHD